MSLADNIDRLRRVPLLSVLDDDGLRHIAFNSDHKVASDGKTLFFEGEEATGAILVLKGSISLQVRVDGQMQERTVLEPGAVADPYALISRSQRSTTAKAIGQVTYMLLDRATFRKVLENYPDLAEKVCDYLARDIDSTVSSLNQIAARLDLLDQN